MAIKLKILMVAWIVMGFLVFPIAVMAQGYPKGNDHAVVGVPGGWKPKVEGQASGPKSGGKKYPAGNDHAVVGVPGGWKASLEASKWSTSGSLASRLPKGNDRAVVGVPKGWMPK